jgi:hypothetical protein
MRIRLIIGSGEFYLMQQGSEDVKMVVRTINSSAFTPEDWEEYVVSVSPPWSAPPLLVFHYACQSGHVESLRSPS